MTDVLDLAHYAWAISLAVTAYFIKNLHGQIKEDSQRIRDLELEVQKQGTENQALFQRMDEVKDALTGLNQKLDALLMRSQ